jgi:hypothetical protein
MATLQAGKLANSLMPNTSHFSLGSANKINNLFGRDLISVPKVSPGTGPSALTGSSIRVRHVGAPLWTSGICCGASARYEPVFRDNEINGKVKTKLTVEDFKELGIGASGTARMLLDAIAQLCATRTPKSPRHLSQATTRAAR